MDENYQKDYEARIEDLMSKADLRHSKPNFSEGINLGEFRKAMAYLSLRDELPEVARVVATLYELSHREKAFIDEQDYLGAGKMRNEERRITKGLLTILNGSSAGGKK